MNNWKSKLQNIFERVDDWSDDVRHRLRKFDDYDDSLLITPYMGFDNLNKKLDKNSQRTENVSEKDLL